MPPYVRHTFIERSKAKVPALKMKQRQAVRRSKHEEPNPVFVPSSFIEMRVRQVS